MNYIQEGHLDDKIVSQLLQIDQTFFVTCDFLMNVFFERLMNISRQMCSSEWTNQMCSSEWTNQTTVFGKYIKLLIPLISTKSLLNRLHFFDEIEKKSFHNCFKYINHFFVAHDLLRGHCFSPSI
jgi:hypothetical protein